MDIIKRYTSYIFILFLAVSCTKENTEMTELTVFTNSSVSFEFENISSEDFYWDFGDGSTSTEKTPKHIYKNPGKYVVSLIQEKRNKSITIHDLYLVNVKQTYNPRIHNFRSFEINPNSNNPWLQCSEFLFVDSKAGIEFTVNYDYFHDYYLLPIRDSVIEERRNKFKYSAFMNGIPLSNVYEDNPTIFETPIFTDTGFYNFSVSITDENNNTSSLDTSIFVGLNETTFKIKLQNQQISQLGNISQRVIFFEDTTLQTIEHLSLYPGPNIVPQFVSNYEIYDANLQQFSPYYGISLYEFSPVSDNQTMTFTIPTNRDGLGECYRNVNNLRLIVAIIGENGISYGERQLTILPGSTVPMQTISLNFYQY